MRKYLVSYITMNKAERWGLVVLGGAVLLLIGVKYVIAMWQEEPVRGNQNNVVTLYQHEQAWRHREKKVLPEHEDASADGGIVLPDKVNINEADSVTLVLLKGIGPVTAHRIIERRAKRPFTEVGQVREVGSFSQETLTILMRHLTAGDVKQKGGITH